MAVTAHSRCQSCDEPFEPGDNFCGGCGADLSALQATPAGAPPTLALGEQAGEPAVPPPGPHPGHASAVDPRTADEPWAAVGAGTTLRAELPTGAQKKSARPDDQAAVTRSDAPDVPHPHAAQPDPRELSYDAVAEAGEENGGVGEHGAPAPAPNGTAQGITLCVGCRAGTVDKDGYCENCGHAQPRPRDHMEHALGRVAAVSDRGYRHHRNEDFFAVADTALPDGSPVTVAAVCDGVSSSTRPDDASEAAAESARATLLESVPRGVHPQQAMHDAIVAAAKAVDALAADPDQPQQHDPYRQQNAPACTIVATVVAGGLLTVGWVGDSRAYWVPDDRGAPAARLTEDDSWAAQMVANNLMSEAEAYADERAHAITGWLGADAYELEPHTATYQPDRPGVVVVCTDGLWNYSEGAEEMATVVPADAHQRPLASAQTLVRHALDSGGHDNVTVAVVPFPVPAPGAGSA